jgi:hypothetical protein
MKDKKFLDSITYIQKAMCKTRISFGKEMKENVDEKDYFNYLKDVYAELSFAERHVQELKAKLQFRQYGIKATY